MSAKSNPYVCKVDVALPTIGPPIKISTTIPLKATATAARTVKLAPNQQDKQIDLLPASIKNVDFFHIKLPDTFNKDMSGAFHKVQAFECKFGPCVMSTNSAGSRSQTSNPSTSTDRGTSMAATTSRDRSTKSGKSYNQDTSSDTQAQDEKGKGSEEQDLYKTGMTSSQSKPVSQTDSYDTGDTNNLGFSNDVVIVGSDIISKIGEINTICLCNNTDDEHELTVVAGFIDI